MSAIQEASPEAAQWKVAEYLAYDLLVWLEGERVAGFVVSRGLGGGEREILTLAVGPPFRRRGVGRGLVEALARECPGAIFLEVRESNQGARMFYKSIGFKEIGCRPGYYETTAGSFETAIVMKFHSC